MKGSRADGPRCIIPPGSRGPEAGRGGGLVFGRGETEDRGRISQRRETQDVSNLMHKPAPSSSRAQSKRAWGEPEPLPAETSWVLRPTPAPRTPRALGFRGPAPCCSGPGASLEGLGFALAAQVGGSPKAVLPGLACCLQPRRGALRPPRRAAVPDLQAQLNSQRCGGAAGATNAQPFLRLAPHRSQRRRWRLHPGQPAIAH